MAPDLAPSSSVRRILVRAGLLVVPLVASAVAVPFALRHFRRPSTPAAIERPDRPPTQAELDAAVRAQVRVARAEERGLENAVMIAPDAGRADAAGEITARFEGFGVEVDSAPPGARVIVNGADLGETPLVASVPCAPGERVEVVVEKRPLRPARRATTCRADTLVKLELDLKR